MTGLFVVDDDKGLAVVVASGIEGFLVVVTVVVDSGSVDDDEGLFVSGSSSPSRSSSMFTTVILFEVGLVAPVAALLP